MHFIPLKTPFRSNGYFDDSHDGGDGSPDSEARELVQRKGGKELALFA